jgi:hypothetical protein
VPVRLAVVFFAVVFFFAAVERVPGCLAARSS